MVSATHDWSMPSPRPIAALKWPPLRNAESSSSTSLRPQDTCLHPYNSRSAASSSSSLSGLEQYSTGHNTTSFQDFVKQTRSVHPDKPLPPTPQALPPALVVSKDGTQSLNKRSSSVYSRTQSQWLPTSYALPAPDFDIDPLPSFNPSLYDENPYELQGLSPGDNSSLVPRPFAPLLHSPSPFIGDVRSRPATLTLSAMPAAPQPSSAVIATPRTKVRLMSISKANRDAKAPGAVHLLPEELRAQTAKKAASHSRLDSLDMLGLGSPPPPPSLPVSAANGNAFAENNWQLSGSRNSGYDSRSDAGSHTYDVLKNSFHVGSGPSREMLPPQPSQERVTLKVPAGIRPRRSDEEPRGRSRERSLRSRGVSASPPRLFIHDVYPYDKVEKARSEKSNDTAGYNLFLAQYDRRPSAPRSFTTMSSTADNDDEVRQHMKMVPQPLFQGKAQAQPRKESTAAGSQESFSSGKSSEFPLRLSLESLQSVGTGMESKGSTTGMIPISPPMREGRQGGQRQDFDDPDRGRQNSKADAGGVSAVYPHIMTQANPKKTRRQDKNPSIGEPRPMLSAFDQSVGTSTPHPATASSVRGNPNYDHRRNISETSTQASLTKAPLYQRAMKGVTKHVRKTSKMSDTSTTSTTSPIAAPDSPHLLPSPVKHLPSPIWTGSAKSTWEAAKSRAQRSRASISIPTPTRPSNERHGGPLDEREASSPGFLHLPLVNGFGTKVLENYREGKAEKRREGLKKMINVVGVGDGLVGRGTSEASSEVDSDSDFEDGGERRYGGNWM